MLSALSQIAKHSVDLAELVVEAEIFPVVLTCLKDSDEYVKKNGATLIREIAKHTPEVKTLKMQIQGHIIRFYTLNKIQDYSVICFSKGTANSCLACSLEKYGNAC